MTILHAVFRAVITVLLLNGLFLVMLVIAVGDSATVRRRVRAAFETGELGFTDFLRFDSRRGFFQYNDCNVLQMLANANVSRLGQAISPMVYSGNDDWTDQCAVLHRVVIDGADVAGLIENRYSRYWHGYNAAVGLALRAMEIRTLRRVLVATVWVSLAVLTLLTVRSGRAGRRVGLMIGLAAALFWGVPYFDPGFTFGVGDAALLHGLAVLAVRPSLAQRIDTLVPFAAGFGALVVFFEMLTGQLPVAAAWLIACVVAARRDHASVAESGVLALALAAIFAFAIGGLVTVASKQLLAVTLFDPRAGDSFFSHLALYADVPDASGGRPGMLRPFLRLWDSVHMLTYGSERLGKALFSVVILAWMLAAAKAWRHRRLKGSEDRVILLAASLIPLAWVLVLPQHTLIHGTFMVRILVAPVALVPLALWWPLAEAPAQT